MSNTLMGMGILSLPFCLKAAGWVGGLSSLVIFGIVAWWTSILIGRQLNGDPRSRNLMFKNDYNNKTLLDAGKEISLVRLRGQLSSFPAIARDAFGQNGNIVLSSVLYFELFSALAVFYISLGDHLHSLFPSVSTTHHMMLVSNVLIVTTVFLKTPQLISYLSTVGTWPFSLQCSVSFVQKSHRSNENYPLIPIYIHHRRNIYNYYCGIVRGRNCILAR